MILGLKRSEMFTEKVCFTWHRLMEVALVRKTRTTGNKTAAVGTLLTKWLIVCIVPENVTGAQRTCLFWFCLRSTLFCRVENTWQLDTKIGPSSNHDGHCLETILIMQLRYKVFVLR